MTKENVMGARNKRKAWKWTAFIILLSLFTLAISSIAFADAVYWTRKADMPNARMGAATGVVNGKIYILGGTTAPGFSQNQVSTVEMYDPSTDSWETKQSLCAPRAAAGEVTHNGTIYVVGGNGPSGAVSTVMAYNTANETCTVVGNLQVARRFADAALLNGKIYIVGGCDADGAVLNTIEEYDLMTNTSTIKATLPAPRAFAGVVRVSNKIYIIGGVDSNFNPVNTCWEYDPSTNLFTAKSPMPVAKAGGIKGATVINGKIYFAGGFTSNALPPSECTSNVFEFDPSAGTGGTWEVVSSMPTARFGASAEIVNNTLYVMGGYDLSQALSVNECAFLQTTTEEISTPISGPGEINCGGTINVRITFPSGTNSGMLVVSKALSGPAAPPANVNFRGMFYDIATSVEVDGTITVKVPYNDTGLTLEQENNLKLYHWNGSSWQNVTTSVDVTNNLIIGSTTSLSPFVVGETSISSASVGYGMNTNIVLMIGSLLLAGGVWILRTRKAPVTNQ